jgi:hypothetical protein
MRFVYLGALQSSSSQIDRHYSTFLEPDMTIEKLQKVATTHVDAHVKARWLRWWNSNAAVKTQNMFPSTLPLRERVLDDWLHKASFWAQVRYAFQIALFSFLILKIFGWGYVKGTTISEPRGWLV